MPKLELGPSTKANKGGINPTGMFDDEQEGKRVFHIPADAEMLESLEVGEEYEVLLKGTVSDISSHEDDDGNDSRHFGLTVSSVEAYPADGNEFTRLAEDDDE